MIDLYFIGIGMGNPDHLTRQAIAELQTADVILIPRKGAQKSDLAASQWRQSGAYDLG
jgi:precorrin-6A synthase